MAQRAIRFSADLTDRITAEVIRMGHPHTFSSFVVNACEAALSTEPPKDATPRANADRADAFRQATGRKGGKR